MGPSVTFKHGVCGVFLDPPYDLEIVNGKEYGRDGATPTDALYNHYDPKVSTAVRAWAIENSENPLLRIALCGYEGEHNIPGSWECVPWKNRGGYASQGSTKAKENSTRERIWFSPACLRPQDSLFRDLEVSA